MVLVKNIKTGQTRYVGEVVAKDLKGLTNMGFELANPEDYPVQPKEEKKSVEGAVESDEVAPPLDFEPDFELPVLNTVESVGETEDAPESPKEVKPKRAYTKRVNKATK